MSKDLLKEFVDFTSSQCLNLVYKPVLVKGYSGLGEYPIDTIIVGDNLILGNNQIPINDVANVEFGYYNDEYKDRIEKVVVDSIQEVKDFIERKYKNPESFIFAPVTSNFPFYEADKIGNGYVLIETTEDKYEIIYPTRKTIFQKQWEKDSKEEGEKKEMSGICKWFNDSKGFGFLTGDDGQDVFVHYTAIKSDEERKTLNQGDKVTFEVVECERGVQAANVQKIA